MNGITKRCVTFAQGNKDPFQRVNYPFGLVLGVDEFVDEQCYFLEKEYMHNRALHGCGTVSGLHVTVEPEGSDIEARVAPGIGIDQYGRLFVVQTRQCASLPAWIGEQELGAGEHTIYVVARYAECETALVPIAGQPCSSSDQLTAPSRIKDFFAIDFTLEPPPHAANDAVINLAEFLHRFRRAPGANSLADLGSPERLAPIIGPDIITLAPGDFLTHINTVVEQITGTVGARLLEIVPQEVSPLLDDIFSYWVTEVRPTLLPDLIAPSTPANSEAGPPPAEILLAQIDLTLAENSDLALENIDVDNSVRPLLLHTQLIQELFDIQDLAGEGGTAEAKPVHDFATIEDADVRSLTLWLHIGDDLSLGPSQNIFFFRIGANGAQNQLQFNLTEDTNRASAVGRYYRLTTLTPLNTGDYLLLRLQTDQIQAGNRPLSDLIANAPFTYANYDPAAETLSVFHIVERAEAIDPEQIREIIRELLPPPQPRVPFVTITPITNSDGSEDFLQSYELWFHLDGIAEQNEGAIELNRENTRLLAETAPGSVTQVPIEIEAVRPNVWLIHPGRIGNQGLPFARVFFPLDVDLPIKAFNPQAGGQDGFRTLRDYIEQSRQQLEGHLMRSEEFDEVLVVYVREQGRARRVE